MRGLTTGAFALAGLLSAGTAGAQGYSYEQERYCTGDAFRLCSAYIPDVDRITACMVQRKAELSPACRAVFGPPRPPAAPIARAPDLRERPYMPGSPTPPIPGRARPPVFDDYDD